jgi:hypothetical protein
MAGSRFRLGAALLVMASLAAGCGSDRDVADAESELIDGYLEPLEATGIHATVEKACRYPGPLDVPWHLGVVLHLDAEPGRVVEVLLDEEVWVVRDRDPMIVQQYHKDTNGWNGILQASGGGSKLDLTFNNAKPSERFEGLGWAEECWKQDAG